MPWLFVAVAIAFEVTSTSFIGTTRGFTRPLPTALVLAGHAISFTMLAQAVKVLEIGIVYAIWSGVGTALIALIGIVLLNESATPAKLAGVGLVIAGVIVLNLASAATPGGDS